MDWKLILELFVYITFLVTVCININLDKRNKNLKQSNEYLRTYYEDCIHQRDGYLVALKDAQDKIKQLEFRLSEPVLDVFKIEPNIVQFEDFYGKIEVDESLLKDTAYEDLVRQKVMEMISHAIVKGGYVNHSFELHPVSRKQILKVSMKIGRVNNG